MKSTKNIVVTGLEAVTTVFDKRPGQVKKLLFDRKNTFKTKEWTAFLAKNKRAYALSTVRELCNAAGTPFHGGILALVYPPHTKKLKLSHLEEWQKAGEPIIVIDKLDNATSLGLIAQTAAYYGIKKIVFHLGENDESAYFQQAAWDISKGAIENIEFFKYPSLGSLVRRLTKHFVTIGYTAIGTGGKKIENIGAVSAPGRPNAYIFSADLAEFQKKYQNKCEYAIQLSGALNTPTLNTGVAAAVILAKFAVKIKNTE